MGYDASPAGGSGQPPPSPYAARKPGQWSALEAQRVKDVPESPDILTRPALRLEEAAGDDPASAVPQEVAGHFRSISGLPLVRVLPAEDVPGGGPPAAQAQALRIGLASVSNAVAAAGTHNVILGLRRFLSRAGGPDAKLWGIRNLSSGNEFEIVEDEISHYLNQPGSDLLPTIPLVRVTERMLGLVAKFCARLGLSGLVFLCGPSELGNVTKVSDYFGRNGIQTAVAGVIHSVSGWVRLPQWIDTNLGFDSACGVLAEITGNIALSLQPQFQTIYHFVCCCSPPLTLELAMQTQPTLCYMGEDVFQRGLTLEAIVDEICDVIVSRYHDHGVHTGVVMVSDDFLEQLVQMRELREELKRLRLGKPAEMRSVESAQQQLPPGLGKFFAMLPGGVRDALVFRTTMDGLPLLKPQETERELGAFVARCLEQRKARGERCVDKFTQQPHNLKHLAVCPMPTLLDCALGYSLGQVAGVLVQHRANGYVASVQQIESAPAQWRPCGVPFVRLLEASPHEGEPVSSRRRLTLEDTLFRLWRQVQTRWRYRRSYRQPGPVQFWRPAGDPLVAWGTYTLRVACAESEGSAAVDEIRREIEGDGVEETIVVTQSPFLQLHRRRRAMMSPLQRWRTMYTPAMPRTLQGNFHITQDEQRGRVCADLGPVQKAFPSLWQSDHVKSVRIERAPGSESRNSTALRNSSCRLAPNPRVGIALIGRAGPGVNNVIQGLFDYLTMAHGTVVCICMGIYGLVHGYAFELSADMLAQHLNQGGCDLVGQSIPEDLSAGKNLASVAETARKLRLDGLVIWGGRNGHTWTAHLAEYFAEQQVPTCVIGAPASVQSELPLIEQTIGHDTVCKLYASIVGNLATQAASSRKLWCFVRIPGHTISHTALEIYFQTHPHVLLLHSNTDGEQLGLPEVSQLICDVIEDRSRDGNNYGVVLIPDQLLASVPEMKELFGALQQIHGAWPDCLEANGASHDFGPVLGLLPPLSRGLFQSLPDRARAQICSVISEQTGRSREVNLSKVETEVIFRSLVETELSRRVLLGTYKGPFQVIAYSLPSIHGRAAMPTNFDCDLGYTMGYAAGILVTKGYTGLLVDVTKLQEDVEHWEVAGTPLSSFLTYHEEEGSSSLSCEMKPRTRLRYDFREQLGMPDPSERTLVNPGPAQLAGPCAGMKTQTLRMPQVTRLRQVDQMDRFIGELKAKACAGCPPDVLQAVKKLLEGGVDLLRNCS